MKCKHRLSEQEALERGWCKTCKTYNCVPFKEEHRVCPQCKNTGITDCHDDIAIVCTNCIWGKRYAMEEFEYGLLEGEFDEMFLTG